MTLTMEILAEGGALLAPGKVLIGMRDVRASRWITLEQYGPAETGQAKPGLAVEIEAKKEAGAQKPGEADAVHVRIRESSDAAIRPVWAEGTMLFADSYPEAPIPSKLHLEKDHKSAWTPKQLYSEGMFHGASFQAVRSMDRAGLNGTVATLEVLPRHDLIAGEPQPAFQVDPVILDAAGQVVAFWSQEKLQPCGDIFPYKLNNLRCYAPLQPVGTRLECRVQATHVSETDIHSDIEIVDGAGRLHYRFESWQDRRFHLPNPFWRLRIEPKTAWLSESFDQTAFDEKKLDQIGLACCRLSGMIDVLETSHGIWMQVLAHLILSRAERQEWLAMQAPPAVEKRRQEWLLGRCAAKDAVRMLIRRRHAIDLCPADVEIVSNASGMPEVRGSWVARLGVHPVVSLSHSSGTAVALAALDPGWLVGIDLEALVPAGSFEDLAFVDGERQVLSGLPDEQLPEWFMRLWCAKESVAKALGEGLTHGLHAVQATAVKTESGLVEVEIRDGLLQRFPELTGKTVAAHTARHKDFICSLVYQRKQGREG